MREGGLLRVVRFSRLCSAEVWSGALGGEQLHDGLKKLNVRPAILLLPEDFDEITNNRLQELG